MTNQTELTSERIEEALHYLVPIYDSAHLDGYKRNLGTALAALRTEQSRQWISVEDRLPDMCGCKCLVSATNQFGQTDVFTAFTGYMEHGKLEFHSCEPTHELSAWTITHWMPLPDAPGDAKTPAYNAVAARGDC